MVYEVSVYMSDTPRRLDYSVTVTSTDGSTDKQEVLDFAYAGIRTMAASGLEGIG